MLALFQPLLLKKIFPAIFKDEFAKTVSRPFSGIWASAEKEVSL